jgi:hypothetical protein
VNSGHETLFNSEVIVDDLCQGSKAVGGARGVGYNLVLRLVGSVVDTVNEDRSIVLGWSGENSLLGTSLDVERTLSLVKEDARAFGNVVSADLSPRNLSWVLLAEDRDLLSVDLDTTLSLFNGSLEGAYAILAKFVSKFAYHGQSRT